MKQHLSNKPEGRCVLIAHPGAELYGSDRVTLESARSLLSEGFKVVVTTPCAGPLVDSLVTLGAEVEVLGVPILRKSALSPWGLLQLVVTTFRMLLPAMRLVRRHHTDVVYVATITLPFWVVVARLCRRPVICHLHEAEVGAPSLVRKALALPVALAHTVLANSDFTLKSLLVELPRQPHHSLVIPNPVVAPTSATPPRERLQDPTRIVCVGRLSPRKGAQVLINAVSSLSGKGIDCHVEFVGDVFSGYEWFRNELDELIRDSGIEERVKFTGFTSNVWPHLEACDIAVVPSIDPEGFGNTAVEAVLAHRPVIASETGGLSEAVADYESAILVQPDSTVALANAIESVILNWDRFRSITQNSALTAMGRHSQQTYTKALTSAVISVYNDTHGLDSKAEGPTPK